DPALGRAALDQPVEGRVDLNRREALGVAFEPPSGRQPLGVELASPLLVVPPRAAHVHRPQVRGPGPPGVSVRASGRGGGGGSPSGALRLAAAQTLTRLAWGSSGPPRATAPTRGPIFGCPGPRATGRSGRRTRPAPPRPI